MRITQGLFNKNEKKRLGALSLYARTAYLLDVLHPLCHLLVTHVVDLLDEGIVLLPEGHPRAGLELPKQRQSHNYWVSFVVEIRTRLLH
jgi:hypothetical protein